MYITVAREFWNANTPLQHPDTCFVFGENINCLTSRRRGGGSAIIRGHPNSIGIITKKRYVYYHDRTQMSQPWDLNFADTDEDFEIFKAINLEQFGKISGYNKVVFPNGLATERARIPTRFAIWLQDQLKSKFGLRTELTTSGLNIPYQNYIHSS